MGSPEQHKNPTKYTTPNNAICLCHCPFQHALLLPSRFPNPFAFAVFGKNYRCLAMVSSLLNPAFAGVLGMIATLCSFLIYFHLCKRKFSLLLPYLVERQPTLCLLALGRGLIIFCGA